MVLCLGGIALVCAALLAVVYIKTKDPISRAIEQKNHNAIAQVSPEFSTMSELKDNLGYITLGEAGDTLAYVINASSTGFGGPIRLMVGFRPDGSIYNTAVLSHSETPGLGAKCTEESFAGQFRNFDTATKKLSVTKDGGDVDAITASTITSRAYCAALENALASFRGLIAIDSAACPAVLDSARLAAGDSTCLAAGATVCDSTCMTMATEPKENNGGKNNE